MKTDEENLQSMSHYSPFCPCLVHLKEAFVAVFRKGRQHSVLITNKKQKLQELLGQLHGATTGAGVKITIQN